MTTRVAVVKKGQLVLKKPLRLPDGTQVKVHIEKQNGQAAKKKSKAEDETDPLLWAAEHAIDTGIPDLAAEHDHYIYGSPKRSQ